MTGRVLSMKITSQDTRERAVQAYRTGNYTQAEVAKMYGVHYKTLQYWLRADDRGEGQALKPRGRPKRSFSENDMKSIAHYIDENPAITLAEMKEKIGINCSLSVYWRAFHELGHTYKKNDICFRTVKTRY